MDSSSSQKSHLSRNYWFEEVGQVRAMSEPKRVCWREVDLSTIESARPTEYTLALEKSAPSTCTERWIEIKPTVGEEREKHSGRYY
jgi:hypothetical protein